MHTAKTKYLTSLILELSTYLGRHPSPSPLLSPDVLADVVDLKLSNELYCYYNEFHSHLPFDRLWLI
jgi:hypothetical protein